MAYSIESTTARRCTTNLNGQQCGLAEHHIGDHVAPDGRQRWAGYPIFGALAEAWADRLGSTSVAAVLAERISAVAQRVESETPLREALASRLDKLEGQLDDADARIKSLGQEITRYVRANRDQAERIETLERDYADPARANGLLDSIHKLDTALVDMRTDLNREKKAREALTVELVNTRRARVSPLEDRVTKLEVDGVHQLKKRLDTLERDLRDTHELAERAATAHLERKTVATHWDARSPEPPRDQTYVDDSGALWRFFNGNGWQGTPPGTKWDPHGGGYTWDELCNSRKNLSRPDFPWKVCTDG